MDLLPDQLDWMAVCTLLRGPFATQIMQSSFSTNLFVDWFLTRNM